MDLEEDRQRESTEYERKAAHERMGRNIRQQQQDAGATGVATGFQGGLLGAALADDGSAARRWLEHIRDQRRREAEEIQCLLDTLPARIPPAVASALQRLLFK